MMKRFVAIFLSLFLITPVMANIKTNADAVNAAISEYFPDGNDATNALATYTEAVRTSPKTGISAAALWNVCTAGGLDIKKSADKQKCQQFVNAIVRASTVSYKAVCRGDKGKSGGTEYCIRDFKNVQVTLSPGALLAKEYALKKHGDSSVQCYGKFDRVGLQDYLQCVSRDKNAFYEFEFDDLKEPIDSTVQYGVQQGVCTVINGVKATPNWCASQKLAAVAAPVTMGLNIFGACGEATCDADASKCATLSESFAKFGYSSQYVNGKCLVNFEKVKEAKDLRNDFKPQISDEDRFVFCTKDIQIRNDQTLETALREWVSNKTGIAQSQIECLPGFRTYTGPGCRVGGINPKDDIKTCKSGEKYIDLVFDDVNEAVTRRVKGGMEGIQCINADGVFDGKHCAALGEAQCNGLKERMKKDYPDAKEIYWDAKNQLCFLPNAKANALTDQITSYAVKSGIAITVVAATIVTGGAASGLVIAGSIAMATGTTLSIVADGVMTFGKFDPFVKEVNACLVKGEAACAEDIVRNKIVTMESYKEHFTPQQQSALDEIFSRLVAQVPDESDFWEDFYNDPEIFHCDKNGENCTVKTKAQGWEIASYTGQALQVAGGLMHLIGNIGQQLKTLEQVRAKVTAVPQRNGTVRNMLTYAHGGNGQGAWVSNELLQQMGYNATNTQLVRNMGWRVGEEIMLRSGAGRGLVLMSKPNGMAILAIAEGLGRAGYDASRKADPLILSRRKAGTDAADTETPQDKPEDEPGDTGGIVVLPIGGGTPDTGTDTGNTGTGTGTTDTGTGNTGIGTGTTDTGTGNTGTGTGNTGTGTTGTGTGNTGTDTGTTGTGTGNTGTGTTGTSTGGVTGGSNRPTTFTPDKGRNTGAIAAAVVGGTLLTGLAVGGIVAATSDKKSSSNNTVVTDTPTDPVLDGLMGAAVGVIGVVAGQNLTLIPLPTTVNTYAPIVVLDGRAVVVVSFNGYKLPYYMNGSTWAPLLGIGETGRWFNVYPTNGASSGITKMDQITAALNAQLAPMSVARYVGNAGGVSFPVAAQSAFATINAEFVNGVIQSADMSVADQKLYSENYAMMQSKMK